MTKNEKRWIAAVTVLFLVVVALAVTIVLLGYYRVGPVGEAIDDVLTRFLLTCVDPVPVN